MHDIKALAFDVFGTVVDWRETIIIEGAGFAREHNLPNIDWGRFAEKWRAGYRPAMDQVMQGELPWRTVDQLHRMILDKLLNDFDLDGLSEPAIDDWNRVWHRLRPWPDSVPGLTRLKRKYIITTLSNGNVSLLVNMARNAGLPWDCIISAELFRRYKPDPETYRGCARLLDVDTSSMMMVASHKTDLRAAAAVGCRTAFVRRQLEHGPEIKRDLDADPDFDFNVDSIEELATALGV
jgi:2-haloacid dehalogenase